MTLNYDQRKAIYDFLPKTVDIPVKGGNILKNVPLSVVYANQQQFDVYPRVVLEYTSVGNDRQNRSPLTSYRKFNNITNREPHIFRTGTLTYTLDVGRADEIYGISGYVLGVKHHFTISEYSFDAVNNQITFTTAVIPDANSTFKVSYHHRIFRIIKGREVLDTLSITIYARDIKQTGPTGMFANGVLVAETIADILSKKFIYYFDESLHAEYNMVAQDVSGTISLDVLQEGEFDHKRKFTIDIAYVESDISYVDEIEEVEMEIEMKTQ